MTLLPVEIHPEATHEAWFARRWYAERNPQAAASLRSLTQPSSGLPAPPTPGRYLHGTRRVLVNRFPFVVVYRRGDSSALVVAIAHAKRKPGYWKERIESD